MPKKNRKIPLPKADFSDNLTVMEDPLKRAITVLTDAEVTLRSLIGDAAKAADYDAVRRLSLAAEQLINLGEELSARATASVARHTETPRQAARALRVGRPRDSRRTSGEFPRYERHNASLWRVAWSKKSRQEYVHKVPRASYDLIVATLAELANDATALLTAEQVVSHLAERDGGPVPSYQVYVTIGFLIAEGLIEKHGREGYHVPDAANLATNAYRAWEAVKRST
jgi:hypothetical protein